MSDIGGLESDLAAMLFDKLQLCKYQRIHMYDQNDIFVRIFMLLNSWLTLKLIGIGEEFIVW